jgi:predicted nucleotidyltransferase
VKRLEPQHARALQSLKRQLGDPRVVLVGGVAIALHTGMPWRQTKDLDLAAAVDPNALAGLRPEHGWQRDPSIEHRWSFERATLVDVLPASPSALANGRVVSPRSGAVMNLVGLDLAFEHAENLDCGDGMCVGLPPLAILVLLKMSSFQDRPGDRGRDLRDIAWSMHDYLAEADERRFDPRFNELELAYREVPSFVLGEDLSRLAEPSHLSVAATFLELVERRWSSEWILGGPEDWRRRPEDAQAALSAFRAGLRSVSA